MKTRVYTKERGIRTLKPGTFDNYKEKYPDVIKVKVPSIKTLERWINDGVCKTIDGCRVEPDGECSHGYPSWLLALGYM